jgi:hypothetical protein
MAFRDFAGERAQRWADAFYFGPPGRQGSWPIGPAFNIFGVGSIRRNHESYIALLVPLRIRDGEVALEETELPPAESDEDVLAAVRNVLPDEPLDQVRILRVPEIIRSATPGTAVYGAMRGTAGAGVTWASGHAGFLTAGHVAIGTAHVTDRAGTSLGNTIHAFDPAISSGGTTPNVDVALIEPPKGSATTRFSSGAPLTASGPIDLHLGTGLTSSTVLAMISWYLWPGIGTYVDLYMTNAACTVGGDSGAAVTMGSSNEVVGMVVGGTKTFASFIQDIHTQIAALKTVTGLSSLSL